MKITVLGSGDTRGVPKVGCVCPTCEEAKRTGFQRKRFSLVIEEKNTRVLVDASPDLRSQLLENHLGLDDFDALLLTHEHYDHVAGLGEFFPTGKKLPVYGLSGTLSRVFSEHNYGYLLDYGRLELMTTAFFQPFSINDFEVLPLEVNHSVETQGFLLNRKVAILTDTRPRITEQTQVAIRNIPLLLTDGWVENEQEFKKAARAFHGDLSEAEFEDSFQKKKLNHLLIEQARAWGEKLGIQKTVALHVAHSAAKHSELARKYDGGDFQIGYDGLGIEI